MTELQTGIDLPQGSIDALRRSLKAQAESLTTGPRLAVFGCTHAASVGALAGVNTVTHEFPCIGNLPPTFVDYALKRLGLDGVLVTGCPPAECYHRLGSHWTGQRFARQRDPQLRSSIDPQRVHIYWARANEQTDLEQEVTRFRQALDEQAQPARQSQDGNDENE
ncbi:MAG: hydrogenase iron-sulfur subunit [Gammaproteobacteria bacterium]|nr:hydrogenase iron-sulfur subunit [Gammaproteobacteria bacterium]